MAKSKPEKDKLLDHNYDGIQELDNPLPRWWVYLFIGSVIFGIGYFVYYSFGFGSSIEEKYQASMQQHQQTFETATEDTGTIDNVLSLASIDEGQPLFVSKCAACHGASGGGLVGPNLTDNYWIHGGSKKEIFRVITNGVPEKGMIAWKAQLSPQEIAHVVSYIVSIKGSNPENAKAPEGQLVK